MTTLQREAWVVAESFTPMFRLAVEVERGAEGPDETELQSWMAQAVAYGHTTEDAGLYAHWLAGELELAWPTRSYDLVVRYRALYNPRNQNGVMIKRRLQ